MKIKWNWLLIYEAEQMKAKSQPIIRCPFTNWATQNLPIPEPELFPVDSQLKIPPATNWGNIFQSVKLTLRNTESPFLYCYYVIKELSPPKQLDKFSEKHKVHLTIFMYLVIHIIIVVKVGKCRYLSIDVKCKTSSTLTVELNPLKCNLSSGCE